MIAAVEPKARLLYLQLTGRVREVGDHAASDPASEQAHHHFLGHEASVRGLSSFGLAPYLEHHALVPSRHDETGPQDTAWAA